MSPVVDSNCNSIFPEDAEILHREAYAGDQFLLRLRAPECARHARPGSFVHLRCDPRLPMRRPLSIMRASPRDGWIELLYKAVGTGTRLLASKQLGERLSLLGPIGRSFQAHPEHPRTLLIGGGRPGTRYWEERGRKGKGISEPRTAKGRNHRSERRVSARKIMGGIPTPPPVIAAMPLLDDLGVPSRLTSFLDLADCFRGYVTDLARIWLQSLEKSARAEVEIFACGPYPMLQAVATLAREFELPCQVSLEEFMACAVGGCAGCVVRVRTEAGPAMQRVCVDGPVFDAYAVFG